MTSKIDQTVDLLQGSLTKAADKGTDMLSKWESDLEKADWRGAKTIHEDLGKLRRQLEEDEPDGSAISELLVKLGESTKRAASQAEGDTVGELESLGDALVKAGEGLNK